MRWAFMPLLVASAVTLALAPGYANAAPPSAIDEYIEHVPDRATTCEATMSALATNRMAVRAAAASRLQLPMSSTMPERAAPS